VDQSAVEVVGRVRSKITEEGLDIRAAATRIGVTEDSLSRHLSGEYVRSDSLAKYRIWLNGDAPPDYQLDMLPGRNVPSAARTPSPLEDLRLGPVERPLRRWRVVDLFSGCGGLSLGFELLADGSVFETALALDIEDAMVATFNVNHRSTAAPVARKVDLSDFINATEVRAFYLDQIRRLEDDSDLDAALATGRPLSLDAFMTTVRRLDSEFLEAFDAFRAEGQFAAAYKRLDSRVLGQTSVIGFHESIRLPLPSTRAPDLGALLWSDGVGGSGMKERIPGGFAEDWLELEEQVRPQLLSRWDAEVAALRKRAEGNGRGQLASSAGRIRSFLSFLDAVPRLREIWLDWRARRDSLRFLVFGDRQVASHISAAYTGDRHAAVVLGGPPCQGFSRIGRGKIRSLRDDRVHVHYDAEAGDLRNRLFEKYVLFVSALAPSVFLFENVRHFQTEVKTPDGTFLATEILAEAIRELSADGLNYRLASRTIMASDHLVPQRRDRFFMAGVQDDLIALGMPDMAEWILTLPVQPEVPLRFALHDLPAPLYVGAPGVGGGLARTVSTTDGGAREISDAAARYTSWIRQDTGGSTDLPGIDSHVARDHRRDDRDWFALMGPGKRWMDYRCDGSETLELMGRAVNALSLLLERRPDGEGEVPLTREEVESLKERLDGHLSIRLLLETVEPHPGEPGHHLLKDTYLRKREGNHGDWLARLDATRPSKTIVTHMGKDTYAYVHPWEDRSLSVREAARIQTFPDAFAFGHLGLVDAFRVIGNAVPPLLSNQMADRVAQILTLATNRADVDVMEAVAATV
jgi:site-specific DNA-cytosine methylase